MAYAVDFLLSVMEGLGTSRPLLFQRDGSLYVASADGFASANYGLRTAPENIPEWEKMEQSPEILESLDATKIDEEKPYLGAIAFGPDDYSFSLREMRETYLKLSGLPDDGKIRMVSHGNQYHSHKYGYAEDGIDVWVAEARVMDREKYLQLIRQREVKIIGKMEELRGMMLGGTGRNVYEAYHRLKFPNCIVLTNNIFVSLPRNGRFEPACDVGSWGKDTRLCDFRYHNDEIRASHESPYKLHLTLNTRKVAAAETESLVYALDEISESREKEMRALLSNMPEAHAFLERLNKIHNSIWLSEISSRKAQMADVQLTL